MDNEYHLLALLELRGPCFFYREIILAEDDAVGLVYRLTWRGRVDLFRALTTAVSAGLVTWSAGWRLTPRGKRRLEMYLSTQ